MEEERILDYAEAHTTPETGVLAALNRETHLTQVYPRMLAGHMQGTLLRMISMMMKPLRVLEIGTFTGYSAICLAAGLTDTADQKARLDTIEVNPEMEMIIRKYLREAGMEERIRLHIGDAALIIPQLEGPWDMVYLDADKPGYPHYYEQVLPLLRKGGLLIADNALWDGKVLLPPEKMDKDAAGLAAFNDMVQADERVENLLLPFRDGLMIARKR